MALPPQVLQQILQTGDQGPIFRLVAGYSLAEAQPAHRRWKIGTFQPVAAISPALVYRPAVEVQFI